MPLYNLKRDVQVFLVYDNKRYSLDVYPDVTVSQTFNETAIKVKTLHSQYNMFDKAVINRANPANFTFTVPVMTEADLKIVNSLLIDYAVVDGNVGLKYFDLYVVSSTDAYKVEKAVIESGVFQLVKDRVISLNVSGTGSKLTRFSGTVPGVAQTRSATRTYVAPMRLRVDVNSITIDNILSVSVEVQNSVEWLNNDSLQSSLNVTSAGNTIFPADFVVSGRVLSGSVQQYVTDISGNTVNTWAIDVPLRIRTGNSVASPLIDIDIPQAVYTNRLDMQDLLVQSFDYRMTYSPENLSTVVKIA